MALTDTTIRNTKPEARPFKIYDARGLFLITTPSGGKWWRFKYRFNGKEKLLSLGIYPDVSLKAARDKRDAARQLVANGIDPGIDRKVEKEESTGTSPDSFEAVAREWFIKKQPTWVASHADRILRRLERDIFPWIGELPVSDIKASTLLTCLRRIEARGTIETAHRALQNCSQIIRYAVATGRAERDPSSDLRGALPPAKQKHLAAITDPQKVGELLRAIDKYNGYMVVKSALQLAPLVFLRPGELRHAQWSEFNLEKAEWNIPDTRMKMRIAHLVPLSKQAIAILTELYPFTKHSMYVLPGMRSNKRPMSDNAILLALRRMGFPKEEMCGHGFRAMARTILDEVHEIRIDFIEHQLAHAVCDPNGRAYNRTAHLSKRIEMMQIWADYLDELKNGITKVV